MTRMAKSFARFREKLQVELPEVLVEETLRFRRQLARYNPEDTGRSEASWNVNVNEPNLTHKDEDWYAPGNESEEAGEVDVDGFALGDSLHTSNTIPYIRPLENGHSQQAPAGFIFPLTIEYGDRLQDAIRRLA